jgi:hypothetical protein
MSRGVTSRVPPARTTRLDWPGSGPKRWRILPECGRDRYRAHENAPVGRCFLPVTDHNMVKHRVQPDLTSSVADREQEIDRLLALGARWADIGRPALNPGPSGPILRETSSASCAQRRRSAVKAERRAPQTHLSAA